MNETTDSYERLKILLEYSKKKKKKMFINIAFETICLYNSWLKSGE